jgi:hypothetical protein
MNNTLDTIWNEYISKNEANIAYENFRKMVDRVAIELIGIPADDYYKDGNFRDSALFLLKEPIMLRCHVILEEIREENSK